MPDADQIGSPKLSVIVPTHDRAALLAEALASINVACADITHEVLVADHDPSEETCRVASGASAQLLRANGRGASYGRNAGLLAATGEYIAFLDDDDLMVPQGLLDRVRFLDEHPGFGAVVAQAVNIDWARTSFGEPWPTGLPGDGDLRAAFLKYYPQIGATLVRASAAREVGVFDEALLNTQDWEWQLRLATLTKVGFVPAPAIHFRQRGDGDSDDLQWSRLRSSTLVFRRGRKLVGWKAFPPGPAFRRLLQLRGAFESYFGRSALRHAQAGDKRAAMRSILKGVAASPIHAAADLVRPSALRSSCWLLLRK